MSWVLLRPSGGCPTLEVLIFNHWIFTLVQVIFDLNLFNLIYKSISSQVLLISWEFLFGKLWLKKLRPTLKFSQLIRNLCNQHIIGTSFIIHSLNMHFRFSFCLMIVLLTLVKPVNINVICQFRIQKSVSASFICSILPFPKMALSYWRSFRLL